MCWEAELLPLEGRSRACEDETDLNPSPVHRLSELEGTDPAVGEGSTSKRLKTQMNLMISD